MPGKCLAYAVSLAVLSLCLCGCQKPPREAALRDRAQQLIGHLCRGEVEPCLEFYDPSFRHAKPAGARNTLESWAATYNEQTIRIDEVIIGADGATASVGISMLDQGRWEPAEKWKWILSDGKWYIRFEW